MFTRCPKCKTVHHLSASLLSHARGLVRCGQCDRTFSALSFLFDGWPSKQAPGRTSDADAAPPVMGKIAQTKKPDQNSAPQQSAKKQAGSSRQLTWGLLALFLLLATLVNIGWTFREPLMQYPLVHTFLKQNGWLDVEEAGLLKDPMQMQLVSRDMHSHPSRSGILVLSLTFVNLAQRTQVFPQLQITLLDATNQPIAQRRFVPVDYLRPGADIASGLAKDVFLPVLLELGDPGELAVGFEIEFF